MMIKLDEVDISAGHIYDILLEIKPMFWGLSFMWFIYRFMTEYIILVMLLKIEIMAIIWDDKILF